MLNFTIKTAGLALGAFLSLVKKARISEAEIKKNSFFFF